MKLRRCRSPPLAKREFPLIGHKEKTPPRINYLVDGLHIFQWCFAMIVVTDLAVLLDFKKCNI